MKWYKSKLKDKEIIFITNKKYTMILRSEYKHSIAFREDYIQIVKTKNMKNNSYFELVEELSDIETLFLDLYEIIKDYKYIICNFYFKEKLKNNRNKEILEFKEYFKELEEKQNSACGEIKE